jgi:hypothetical protein
MLYSGRCAGYAEKSALAHPDGQQDNYQRNGVEPEQAFVFSGVVGGLAQPKVRANRTALKNDVARAMVLITSSLEFGKGGERTA